MLSARRGPGWLPRAWLPSAWPATAALLLALPLPGEVRDDAKKREPALRVGFGQTDITPEVGKKPVYLGGFGHNRQASGVHDPLFARAIVLQHAGRKIAIVSIDVVGLFHERVERVRQNLPGFTYVLVSSTHNHEGPDTLGLWGANPFRSGVDPGYLKRVEAGIVAAVKQADGALQPVRARLGAARAPELLHDSRDPQIKHDELIAIQFLQANGDKNVGLLVQWNCHPETLDSKNTRISADFVGAAVKHLQDRFNCPVVYLTGTVGGLMTSLRVEVRDDKGVALKDGTLEKTLRYGQLVGKLAEKALAGGKGARLTPLQVRARQLFLPLDNDLFGLGWTLGVLERSAYEWDGEPLRDIKKARVVRPGAAGKKKLCIRSELAWLHFGELDIACIPGEIFPELVLDKVQDPADRAADFADAEIEPAVYKQLKGPHRMLIGLANDEIGYIIPKRQWDTKAPFCYGRKKAQYGEINSLGPETAPILCRLFKELTSDKK